MGAVPWSRQQGPPQDTPSSFCLRRHPLFDPKVTIAGVERAFIADGNGHGPRCRAGGRTTSSSQEASR